MEPTIVFTRAYQEARDPIPADKSALGMAPTSGFQYCEALRAASSFGWYVFPPKTISLMFDGREVFIADHGQWRVFTHESLESSFQDIWNMLAPEHLKGHAPSYVRTLPYPGVVQIWSGHFVETAPGYSMLIRPLANVQTVSAFACYEGIVETDSFRPLPLFVNLRLIRTDSEILMLRDMPLFQVCAIPRSSLSAQRAELRSLDEEGAKARFDWSGLMNTLRIDGVTPKRSGVGNYGSRIKKASKRTSDETIVIDHLEK